MSDPVRPDYFSGPANQYAQCPKCGGASAQPVGFTWWGGLLGPKMLTHVRCGICGTCYNGKTGRSNSTAITIYVIVSSLIGISLFLLYRFSKTF